ncbi:TnsD family Tn7-like transposition protein [Massilia sp. GCM10023247]|uniref:TnsD family Tn7-like transposition protein n=1 Tax=Massilia sp. GCM10023247 TaxID=3252643 RepID=UPI0036136966
MLAFFPPVFPDESLYSLLARYHRLSGHISQQQSLRELFGHPGRVVMSDLPSGLQALANVIPGMVWTTDRLIDEMTLFPYFSPYLSDRQVISARRAMAGSTASGLKMLLGLLASRLGGRNRLRFCERCRQRDTDERGLAYWHRVHQLPGVWFCPLHGCALAELQHENVLLMRQCLLLPDNVTVDASRPINVQTVHEASLARLAQLSEHALRSGGTSAGAAYRESYRARAETAGLLDRTGRIRIESITAALADYMATLPTEGEFAFAHADGAPGWALKLLRKPRGTSSHPLKHLILTDCLDHIKSTTISSRVPAVRPHRQPVDGAHLHQLVAVEGNSLRMCAALLGVSTTTVRVEAGRQCLAISVRPKRITASLEQAVVADLRTGTPVAEVATAHALSLPSVYRMLRMHPAVEDERQQQRLVALRLVRREGFLAEAAETPVKRCRDYAWLWRNDREWLASFVDSRRTGAKVDRRACVDWVTRDTKLAKAIYAACLNILRAPGRPRRASRTALLRATGEADTIERASDLLPQTHAMLEHCSESAEEFRHRRLQWATCQLIEGLQPLQRWRLLRLAAIRSTAEVKRALMRDW